MAADLLPFHDCSQPKIPEIVQTTATAHRDLQLAKIFDKASDSTYSGAAKLMWICCTSSGVLVGEFKLGFRIGGQFSHTCSWAPALRDLRISRMVLNWGAQMGHSLSFSPRFLRLQECPHMKCTAGSSRGAPVTAHLLFWNTRACKKQGG